jgi:fucose permease
MLSRIAAAGALKTLGKRQLVLIAAVGSFIGCSILLSANSLALLFAGTALIGFSYGPIFPTTLAIAGDRYPNLTGTVFGLLFSIALVGGMLMPVAVGQVSQRTDVRRGMIMPFFGAIAICTLAAIVKWRDRRQNH